MLFAIMFVIITLTTIGIISGTHPTDSSTKANTTDLTRNLVGFTIPTFDDWCAEHTEQEAVERPSLFMPLPELTNELQHIDIPTIGEWCEEHTIDTDGDRPSLFMPTAELTNCLPTLGGADFAHWCNEHPVIECAPTSKVCALEVPVNKLVEVEPVSWAETDNDFGVLREVLKQYSEVPGVQEEITWDVWCSISSAVPKKVAEDIMAEMSVGEILSAAADKNANAFRKVVGVGPKRAALIISCLYEFWTEHDLPF